MSSHDAAGKSVVPPGGEEAPGQETVCLTITPVWPVM